MKNRAMRIPTAALALLLAGTAPLAAHGDHPEAAGGLLHLVLHLLGSPWAWVAGAAAVGVGLILHGARTACRPAPESRQV